MKSYKIFLLSFIIFSSCNCDDDQLTLERMDYLGNELKTDGYYYSEFESNSELAHTIYFIYTNGILLYGRSSTVSALPFLEEQYINGEFYEMVRDAKNGWGVFKVFGNEIEFERWYPDIPLKTFVRSGVILNDSTFQITTLSNSDRSDTEVIDELYHFKAFSPKPDSTNMFIN